MIQIKRFVCNMLQENCYVVSDESGDAVIIDCGAYYNEERKAIVNYIRNNCLTPKRLLCTHGHFDHNFGNDTIWHEFGLKPEVATADAGIMNLKQQVSAMLGVEYEYDVPPVGHLLSETEVISFGSHQFAILPTPGHTRGSVTFYCQAEKAAFTGDTLFQMSIGRTDFESGSWSDMQESLRQLAKLPHDTTVYPGHGNTTTIGAEVRFNPYMH